MFVTLEKIAQTDPKYADIFLLENYAAFQNRYSFSAITKFLFLLILEKHVSLWFSLPE